MKSCCRCKISKEYSEFYKDKKNKDGYYSSCKTCKKEYEKEYSKTDKYKEKIRKIRWKEQNIDITYEQYLKMFLEQKGSCAICGSTTNQFNKGMCVDHNHSNGKIRGLLCTDCNRGIGSLKDDISLLKKAIEYLGKYDE